MHLNSVDYDYFNRRAAQMFVDWFNPFIIRKVRF